MSRSFILIFDKILQRFTIYHALSVWCMAFTMQINYNISKNSICKCEFLPSHALLLFVMSNMGMIPRWSGEKQRQSPAWTDCVYIQSSFTLRSDQCSVLTPSHHHNTTQDPRPKTSPSAKPTNQYQNIIRYLTVDLICKFGQFSL